VDDPELMQRVDAMTEIAARIDALDGVLERHDAESYHDTLPNLGQVRQLLKRRLCAAAGQLNQDCTATLIAEQKGT
jgi:hypothetical protein